MRPLVRLRTRPSRDGETFVYMLDCKGENGKRKRVSLGHADRRKAEKERPEQNFAHMEVTKYVEPKGWQIIDHNESEGIEPRNAWYCTG